MIIKGYIFSVLYVLVVLLFAQILYKLGLPKKYTRKLVHILVGFEWLILYHFFGGGIHTFLVCLFFLILLLVEYRVKLLPMMSSDDDNAPGTVYYALAMTLVSFVVIFIPDLMIPFGISVFATSIGDGFAGLVGQLIQKHNPKIWGTKTLFGTLFCFLSTILVALIFDIAFSLPIGLWHYLFIAILACELELFVGRGIDNVAITLGISAYVMLILSLQGEMSYSLPILLTPAVVAIVAKLRILTVPGIIFALIMDVLISIAFNNLGFLILILYFLGSLLSDKYKKRRKCKAELSNIDKTRSFCQVFANGIAPTLCSILYILTGKIFFFVGFVASLSEALADTVASGIGSSAKWVYDPFKRKKCTPGISGGMSIEGTISSLLGAVALASLSLLFLECGAKEFLIISAAAFFGCVLDSALGSLLQAKFKCTVCSSTVEDRIHCQKETELISGLRFVGGSAVNLVSSLFSAALAILLTLI